MGGVTHKARREPSERSFLGVSLDMGPGGTRISGCPGILITRGSLHWGKEMGPKVPHIPQDRHMSISDGLAHPCDRHSLGRSLSSMGSEVQETTFSSVHRQGCQQSQDLNSRLFLHSDAFYYPGG